MAAAPARSACARATRRSGRPKRASPSSIRALPHAEPRFRVFVATRTRSLTIGSRTPNSAQLSRETLLATAAHDASRKVDASASKLSRLETGRRNAPIEDVAALLAVYGVTGTRRGELLDLAREAERRGWWQRNRPDFTERQRTLVSLESKASRITNFEPVVVPGLLQTGEYTRAIMVESGMVEEEDLEQHMVGRMRRHSVLLRQYPPGIVALIDELVLHRIIGGQDVLRRQIEHLLQWSLRPHVTIRVIRNEMAHAGIIGAFTVITQAGGPTVTFMENLTSSLFVENPNEVEPYQRTLRRLSSHALDERESAELMSEVATSLDSERTEA